MSVTHFILATAGHVDHGKSALVIALTGTDPDRLPEEKSRGITIELGFAHLDLPARDGKTFRVGVVDVPGHEDFVRNMVAGVGSIDVALIVVAADDGWMPQTEEHLQILEYLGVTRGVVALTKVDLVADESAVREQIRSRLSESSLRDTPIVSTSTKSNRGIDELKTALTEVLAKASPPRDINKPRLALDRAFSLRGVGTVVTGTLSGGALRRGKNVVIQPAGIATRIRNLQSHNQDVEIAPPGSRVALNLADVEPRTDRSALGDRVVGRGDVVTIVSLGAASEMIDVVLMRSPRAPVRAMKNGAIVQVHHGSRSVGARVQLIDRDQLAAGEKSLARLRLHEPIFAFVGDRFVIRDWSEQQTLAGGIVLDVHPRRSLPLETTEMNALAIVSTIVAQSAGVERATILAQSIFPGAEIEDAIDQLVKRGEAVIAGSMICPKAAWDCAQTIAIATIDAHHRAHPDQAGLSIADLRAKLDAKFFDALIAHLCASGFARRGVALARTNHAPALPAHMQAAGEAIRKALRDNPLDPPSRAQLAPNPISFQAVKFLLSSGEVVEISKEIVLSSTALDDAINRVREHIRTNGPATVSELKNLLKSSRRIMVPLLEKLDRDGVTRRDGDRRDLK